MKFSLPFVSITPKELKKGKTYLCGSLPDGENIEWTCRTFDGTDLLDLAGNKPTWPLDEEFMCSFDGFTATYLLFELPEKSTPLESSLVKSNASTKPE